MITLNSERGFVKVEKWGDIEELAGFTLDLNPKEHELKEIIGQYNFKERIKCGLSSCHSPHGKGYIVSTKSGRITNIGQDCGKTYFHVEFDQLSKSFDRDVALFDYRENIGNFLRALNSHKQTISNLRKGTFKADEIFKRAQCLIQKNSGCPESVISILSNMIKTKTPDLIKIREASEKEIDILESTQDYKLPRPYYIDEKIGLLKGLSFLYKENNLRDLIILDIESGFKTISELDINAEEFKNLKDWSKWCSEFESKLEKSKSIINTGVTFLEKDNLLQLGYLISDTAERKEYKNFITNLLKPEIFISGGQPA